MVQHSVQTLLMSIEFDLVHWYHEDVLGFDPLAMSGLWAKTDNFKELHFEKDFVTRYLYISSLSPRVSRKSSQILRPWRQASRPP